MRCSARTYDVNALRYRNAGLLSAIDTLAIHIKYLYQGVCCTHNLNSP